MSDQRVPDLTEWTFTRRAVGPNAALVFELAFAVLAAVFVALAIAGTTAVIVLLACLMGAAIDYPKRLRRFRDAPDPARSGKR